MGNKTINSTKNSQADKFREAAKAAQTDDDEARFDERLKQIVKGDPAGKPEKQDSQN